MTMTQEIIKACEDHLSIMDRGADHCALELCLNELKKHTRATPTDEDLRKIAEETANVWGQKHGGNITGLSGIITQSLRQAVGR